MLDMLQLWRCGRWTMQMMNLHKETTKIFVLKSTHAMSGIVAHEQFKRVERSQDSPPFAKIAEILFAPMLLLNTISNTSVFKIEPLGPQFIKILVQVLTDSDPVGSPLVVNFKSCLVSLSNFAKFHQLKMSKKKQFY
jgi:hypothetical protein